MKRKFIVHKNSKFQIIFKKGRSVRNSHFIVYHLKNEFMYNRYGFAVAKKDNGAVKRNKARRQLKMMVSGNTKCSNATQGCDIIIITRKVFFDASFEDNKKLLLKLLLKIR